MNRRENSANDCAHPDPIAPIGASRRAAIVGRAAAAAAMSAVVVAASCNLYYGDADQWKEEEKRECLLAAHDSNVIDPAPLELGTTIKASPAPPPISGGTLAITGDETHVVVSDPDRDVIQLVSLVTESVVATVALDPGDEPGRIAVDWAGRAHVALRGSDAVATIDTTTGALLARRVVCPAPRGIAADDTAQLVYVACHGGEFVTLDPETGAAVKVTRLDNGLRDVVVSGDFIYVTVFRTADVLVLDREFRVLERKRPPGFDTVVFDAERGEDRTIHFEPAVAWRAVPRPAGGIVVMHQRGLDGKISIGEGGYGSAGDSCVRSVVHGAVTTVIAGQPTRVAPAIDRAVLPVDVALLHARSEAMIIAAGNPAGDPFEPSAALIARVDATHDPFDCAGTDFRVAAPSQPVAAVIDSADQQFIIQSREPAQLILQPSPGVIATFIDLSVASAADTGHRMFHMNSGRNIACASCHPEGGDDGRVWKFDCIGDRRTQSLQFGLLGTEPFHWDGDMVTLDKLMSEVFVGRMGAGKPSGEQIDAMAQWLDTLRPPPRSIPEDVAAVDRGRALFESPTVGCLTCHNGPKLTNNGTFDVGTGGPFQVPSLIGIADRAPFLHTGCAPTLRARFTDPECGGGDLHGVVSGLTSAEIDDLVAYLETL